MNITDLPPEVVLTIFLHLKTKFVLSTLTQVCKLFYHLITPDSTWKTRFWKLWPDKTTNNDSQYISRLANKYFTVVKLFNFLVVGGIVQLSSGAVPINCGYRFLIVYNVCNRKAFN